MLIARLGAERQVDFSSQILGELNQMARSEYIAFVFLSSSASLGVGV
jgi:hypothetical protein